MLKLAGEYFSALWKDGMARMNGFLSLAFTIAGVYTNAFTGSNSYWARWFWFSAAILCFLIANFTVWADEHKSRIKAEDANSPDLKVEIVSTVKGPWGVPGSPDQSVFMVLEFKAVNRGAPSFLDLQEVSTLTLSGLQKPGKMLANSINDTQIPAKAAGMMTLLRADHIATRFNEPIVRGEKRFCWGIFVFQGVDYSDIGPSAEFYATFTDIAETQHMAKIVVGTIGEAIMVH